MKIKLLNMMLLLFISITALAKDDLLISKDKINITTIENLFCEKTYLGLLLGIPNERITKSEMKSFQSEVLQLNYGEDDALYNKYIYITPPMMIQEKTSYGKKYSRLPNYACAARLVSNTVIKDKDSDFSEVILIFYLENNPIMNGVNFQEVIKKLSWKSIAHDTSY
jgi:hypothetical protein